MRIKPLRTLWRRWRTDRRDRAVEIAWQTQVREQQAARQRILDAVHRDDDRHDRTRPTEMTSILLLSGCPICRVPACEALQSTVRYLEEHSDPAGADHPPGPAMIRTLTYRRRLATRLARRISAAHWPGPDDRCRVCGITGWVILALALAWLDATGDPYPPPGWPWS